MDFALLVFVCYRNGRNSRVKSLRHEINGIFCHGEGCGGAGEDSQENNATDPEDTVVVSTIFRIVSFGMFIHCALGMWGANPPHVLG